MTLEVKLKRKNNNTVVHFETTLINCLGLETLNTKKSLFLTQERYTNFLKRKAKREKE